MEHLADGGHETVINSGVSFSDAGTARFSHDYEINSSSSYVSFVGRHAQSLSAESCVDDNA